MSNWARKYQGLYADGKEKIASLLEYTPPVPEVLTEEFRGGGMDMAISMDMGMAAMEASFSIGEDPDILALFGIKKDGKKVPFFIRSHLENDVTGAKKTVIEELRGLVSKIDHGTKSGGTFTGTTVTIKPSYYKYEVDGTIIHEFDPINMIRTINGVDQLAEARASLGK
ncbi:MULTISPECIES: phage major tail tube protein [unclassified Vibrio]|uniref:phage major tail tube protein n=1 Tax=unclassified Vibrio TaxID=2614977 RepID=UPI000B8E4BDB|nr:MULTISPECIES: phage major tail tube protein [unclassified Vibrio]NAX00012.1 phage major tail tube protein [Vibrio sp. V23_P3S9T160]OXX40751.1 phage major tail tube protein [Vibrio sp. V11_P1A41T118]